MTLALQLAKKVDGCWAEVGKYGEREKGGENEEKRRKGGKEKRGKGDKEKMRKGKKRSHIKEAVVTDLFVIDRRRATIFEQRKERR